MDDEGKAGCTTPKKFYFKRSKCPPSIAPRSHSFSFAGLADPERIEFKIPEPSGAGRYPSMWATRSQSRAGGCGVSGRGPTRFHVSSRLVGTNSRRPSPRQIACEAFYSAKRDTEFTVVELNSSRPVVAYLEQVERIVQVTFPDESRRKRLEDGVWEVTLLQQDFFGVKFSPSARLRVWNDAGVLGIRVSDIDLSDLPDEIRVPATLKVEGRLGHSKKAASSKIAKLGGEVEISLDVDVPFPYSSFPLLRETVEAILGGVIGRLEGSLKSSLPRDYAEWTRAKPKEFVTTAAD